MISLPQDSMTSNRLPISLSRWAPWILLLGTEIAASAVLMGNGQGRQALAFIAILLVVSLFSLLTMRFTEPPPPPPNLSKRESATLWLQAILLTATILWTAWRALAFHHQAPNPPWIPVFSPLLDSVANLGNRILSPSWFNSPSLALQNPFAYCILPSVFLVPLTGWRFLGLDAPHRPWRVVALWCAIPCLALVAFLLQGNLTPGDLTRRVISNTLQNGPFEEFLFRGALLSRLTPLVGNAWGLAFSSWAFGLWHLGFALASLPDPNLPVAIAHTLMVQTVIGFGLGVIFLRTRNLVAPSVCHVLFNCL